MVVNLVETIVNYEAVFPKITYGDSKQVLKAYPLIDMIMIYLVVGLHKPGRS